MSPIRAADPYPFTTAMARHCEAIAPDLALTLRAVYTARAAATSP